MPASPELGIILPMTAPRTLSRILLLPETRADASARPNAAVRRYRLARLRLDGREADRSSRFEHLKRSYD
jgi:hypothetical protein